MNGRERGRESTVLIKWDNLSLKLIWITIKLKIEIKVYVATIWSLYMLREWENYWEEEGL